MTKSLEMTWSLEILADKKIFLKNVSRKICLRLF